MRCLYCDVEVTTYPDNGICIHCGGRLPPKPAQEHTVPQPVQVQPVYIPVSQPVQHGPLHAGKDCCPKCHSTQIIHAKQRFRWGLGLLGLFIIPPFGFLFGFAGKKKLLGKCSACGHKWNPQKY